MSEGKSSMVVVAAKYASDACLEMLLALRECVCASVLGIELRMIFGRAIDPMCFGR